MEPRRLKIVCENGLFMYSKIVDAETGEPIRGVTNIDIHMGIDNQEVTAVVTFVQIGVEVTAKTRLLKEVDG